MRLCPHPLFFRGQHRALMPDLLCDPMHRIGLHLRGTFHGDAAREADERGLLAHVVTRLPLLLRVWAPVLNRRGFDLFGQDQRFDLAPNRVELQQAGGHETYTLRIAGMLNVVTAPITSVSFGCTRHSSVHEWL